MTWIFKKSHWTLPLFLFFWKMYCLYKCLNIFHIFAVLTCIAYYSPLSNQKIHELLYYLKELIFYFKKIIYFFLVLSSHKLIVHSWLSLPQKLNIWLFIIYTVMNFYRMWNNTSSIFINILKLSIFIKIATVASQCIQYLTCLLL